MNVVEGLGLASALLTLVSVLLIRVHLPRARLLALDEALTSVESELQAVAKSACLQQMENLNTELAR